jgi:transposase-like protein
MWALFARWRRLRFAAGLVATRDPAVAAVARRSFAQASSRTNPLPQNANSVSGAIAFAGARAQDSAQGETDVEARAVARAARDTLAAA